MTTPEPTLTEASMIFCSNCGAQNLLTAETCIACGVEMVRPHPIQLAGGEIYTLRCGNCGRRLPVVKTTGTTTCASCGLTYSILTGDGYLTVTPAPSTALREREQDYILADDAAAVKPPTFPEKDPEIQKLAAARAEKNERIARLETTIHVKIMQLKDRISRRKGGLVILLLGLVMMIFPFLDNLVFKLFRSKNIDPILFVVSIPVFLIGFVLMVASGKSGTLKLMEEIKTREAELGELRASQVEKTDAGENK